MDSILNFAILKNPLNWIIIILMLLIAGFAFDVLARHYQSLSPKSSPNEGA